jgi:hypothetical protein
MILFLVSYSSRDYRTKAITDFTLDCWIDDLASNKKFMKLDASDNSSYAKMGMCDPYKIVTVGEEAWKIMSEEFTVLDCFKLPDPSPTNSFLNNTVQVEAVLEECKKWLGN